MTLNNFFDNALFASEAPRPWASPAVDATVAKNVLYLPIADDRVKAIPVQAVDEAMVDLLNIAHPRLKTLCSIEPKYQNTYVGFSKVRLKVYEKMVNMLSLLPQNVGIAYFEGYRPLWKQKEYFDKKLKELLIPIKDKELAYQSTTQHVSPFIQNIPPHATGAAIDMTLFEVKNGSQRLLDMGFFDTIYGPNPQQETFSENTTRLQRQNRLLLLSAATSSGLVNYGFEWWHYSYGDQVWGYVKQQKAIYDLVADAQDPLLSLDKACYLEGFVEP